MAEELSTNEFTFAGILRGHTDWVTCIQSGHSQKENEDSDVLVSGSRDKKVIVWKLFDDKDAQNNYGYAYRALSGHSHFISDITISQDNSFVISGSWDKSLRLWDLKQSKCTRQFYGHTKEVLTVSFSPDNRQIISSGADREIKLWNTLADCKYTTDKDNHADWVSCVRYSPVLKSAKSQLFAPYFASVGWDGRLKVWSTNFQIRYSLKAHEGNINQVSISPNGKYIATGGRDKKLLIWDILDLIQPSRSFDAGSTINCIAFNPKMQWVAVGTESCVKVWDLMSVNNKPIAVLEAEAPKKEGTKK